MRALVVVWYALKEVEAAEKALGADANTLRALMYFEAGVPYACSGKMLPEEL